MVVASRSNLIDLDQQTVHVAIDAHLSYGLSVPAGFSLDPELLPRPTPVGRSSRIDRLSQRFAVHPSHHQPLSARLVLNNGGNQSVGIKFQLV
jgi:hypothetical protein